MKNFFILVLVIGLSLGLVSPISAQKVSLGLKGGGAVYYGDANDQKIGPYGGLSLDLWLSEHFAIGAMGYGAQLKGEEGTFSFKNSVYGGAGLLKLRAFSEATLNPYILAGVEAISFDPTDADGNKFPNSDSFSKESWGIPLGAGVAIFLAEKLSLDLEGMVHLSQSDALDGWVIGSKNDDYLTMSLGLTFYFGKPKDTDGDGIPDKLDADKLKPEDFDGFEDSDGAPDYDNDQDGIIDLQDKAPLEAEDQDDFQDADGVPDPDNDGDGILDVNDKCPGTDKTLADKIDTKEDMDGFQDADGCPDPDNDGDGILDANDKCPGTDKTLAEGTDTKETMNEYEDTDGCPDKKPEIAVEKGQAIVLEGIYFASGSAKLDPNSEVTLGKVVRTMSENPDLEVEIRGYTDNRGKYESNVRLSQQRAESVRDYLVRNGINAARIMAHGFGPESPIASNDTRDGRAKNRRIEFFRTK